ncbi:MAG: LysE/ArgO family amino acid transporter [Pseudomonadota bacterium]|uniref:LysE/ArgO family amino acid transporter n=1 Tax=Fodinicurvata fenggangensis TaxID=1121830 RepID=UPI00047E6A26|nr:LysE/ArgO family amino acid transporter [Fodinicurvata fenggangensis]
MTSALLPGFLLGFSLILAIGSQNAFVLRQGLRGEHLLAVCLVCAFSDAVLISVGVAGFGEITRHLPGLEPLLRYAGAAFLLVYGARSFRAAWRGKEALDPARSAPPGLTATLGVCLALTWLNPHVYLDTVVLLGSVSTQYPGEQGLFALGAITASFVFFFMLGYGARLLRPLFARPAAWQWLEAVVGVIMWAIALQLVLG